MSIKTFLITGGRAPVALDLARQFSTQKHRVIMVESIPIHLCTFSRSISKNYHVPAPREHPQQYLSQLIEIIINEQVDHLIPTCEEIYTIAQGLDQFPNSCTVWTEPIHVLDRLHHKWTFIQDAQQYGWQTPFTQQITSFNEIRNVMRQKPEIQKWALKPVYSRFSTQMYLLSSTNLRDINIKISITNPWVLQEWITGKQICTYCICYRGQMLAYAAYPTIFTAGLGASISFEPYENKPLQHQVAQWVRKNQYTGQFAFDWIETERNKWLPIECNPRTTSGIHLFSETESLAPLFEKMTVEEILLPQKGKKKILSLAMLFYGCLSIDSFAKAKKWLTYMISSKDILFRWNDPIPALVQFWMISYFWLISKKLAISITSASTYDIEWNGEKK